MTARAAASGPNPLPPARMRPEERRAELAAILALGLLRLRSETDRSVDGRAGRGGLPFGRDPSGDDAPQQQEAP
jgi:hypothetical protein